MPRPTFIAVGLTIAGSLASAHLLAAAILPPPPHTVSLELLNPLTPGVSLLAGGGSQNAVLASPLPSPVRQASVGSARWFASRERSAPGPN